ncbi:MAG TPA: aldo/keto reductase [Chitinophagaceae bacterium]|nr:aldo/keto reductase [Chitinophagaceae bacterium]
MEKIYLSDSGPKVSPAVYGFWRWEELGSDSYAAMEKTVHLCLELGINTFDHADVYGGYEAESLFGKIIRQNAIKREDIVLFSKCGHLLPHPNRPEIRVPYYDSSASHIQKTVERSLDNLKTDYLDILLLDQIDPLSNLEETALCLEKLRSSGKVRNIGVANFSVFQHQLLASYLKIPIVTNYIELSLLNTSALDNGQLDYIRQKFMRPLVSAPLAGGRIEIGADPQAIQVRSKLEELGKKYNANVESLAVAWLNSLGAIPLIGTFSEHRIRNIVNSFSIKLDQQDWYDLYNTSRGKK